MVMIAGIITTRKSYLKMILIYIIYNWAGHNAIAFAKLLFYSYLRESNLLFVRLMKI